MTWRPDYVTGDELAAYARADATADADQLALAVTAASRAVDRDCHRQFRQQPAGTARYSPARWDGRRCALVAAVDDLMTEPSEVAVDDGRGTFTVVTDPVTWLPRNAPADGEPWTMAQLPASVTSIA